MTAMVICWRGVSMAITKKSVCNRQSAIQNKHYYVFNTAELDNRDFLIAAITHLDRLGARRQQE